MVMLQAVCESSYYPYSQENKIFLTRENRMLALYKGSFLEFSFLKFYLIF